MSRAFESQLAAFRRRWQYGLLLQTTLRLAGLICVVYGIYALLDFLLGFESGTRYVINCVLGVIAVGAALRWVVRVIRYSSRDAAVQADRLSGNKRRAVLSALELLAARKDDAVLSDFLLEQSVTRAGTELGGIPTTRSFPKAAMSRQGKVFAIQLVLLLGAIALQTPGAGIVLERILHPSRDVPPFTGLVFNITPETPQITYGGDATINVEITGGAVKSQVYFLARSGGTEYQTACFQEGRGRFAQKLEKVVQPLEFAFATGRARSRWQKVDLLLQPRVAQAQVTITPPAYTGLPKQSAVAGKAPLVGIVGSTATLSITSNRPLQDGTLLIHPPEELGSDTVVNAVKTGPQTVSFTWPLRQNADLNVTIRDVRGTPNGEPFHLVQQATPDQAPQAVITEPGTYALATPDSTLTFAGYAEDDLGLSRVDIVRTVVGFRDRGKRLGPDTPQRRVDFSTELEMKKLGVAVGQTLEFYLEATDTNPTLMGIGTSGVVRIEIISTENYAQMIRDRTTLEEFIARYSALSDRIDALHKALDHLQETAYSGTDADKERALKEAQDQAQKAAELFEKMGKDFPAFDSDKALSKAASEIGGKLGGVKQKLAGMKASDSTLGESARDLSTELGGAEQRMHEQKQTAQEIAAVSRVMESVAAFQKVVLQQTELERQFNRIDQSGQSEDKRMLEALGERQNEVRTDLKNTASDLAQRVGELPRGYEPLSASVADFLAKLGPKMIPEDMDAAAKAAKNQSSRDAARMSSVALEKLRQMLSQCKCMGGMCQGELTFKVPDPLNQTMQQMLKSLLSRASGSGNSGGVGVGGFGTGEGESGGSMGGNSPLNTPVYGPARMSFGGSGPYGNGAGAPKGGNEGVARVAGSDQMNATETAPMKSKGTPVTNVPEKYRDAVKQYFSQPEDKR